MITRVMSADELIDATLRRETVALLRECTGLQRRTFELAYPSGVNGCTSYDLRTAYELCRTTVQANRERHAAEASQR